jgi:hypothetical protein
MGSTKLSLRCLLASHALLGTVPTAICLVPADIRFLPLLWALFCVSFGQMMLLGFWIGMGAGRAIWRLFAALLGCAYLAVWPSVVARSLDPTSSYGRALGGTIVMDYAVVLAFAAAFFVLRRWFSELRSVADVNESAQAGRLQYSILNVLILTAVVALLLGLMRVARPSTDSAWVTIAATVFAFVVLLIDALCAVWATLSVGRTRWRLLLVFLVAALLGLLQSVNLGHTGLGWWLVLGWVIVSVIPIAVVVASLMVVRRCGYRLVPKV